MEKEYDGVKLSVEIGQNVADLSNMIKDLLSKRGALISAFLSGKGEDIKKEWDIIQKEDGLYLIQQKEEV